MPNGTYGGVRGKETKIGRKTFVSLPTRFVCVLIIYKRIDGKFTWTYRRNYLYYENFILFFHSNFTVANIFL